jgi:hypothetical protein
MMAGYKKIMLCGLIVALTSFVSGAMADIVPYDRQLMMSKASTADDVGVAFLKTTGNFPDFPKMVEESPAYKSLDPLAQKDFLTSAVSKLQSSYLAYSPKKSSLIVRVGVKVNYLRNKDGTARLDIKPPAEGQLYFPYMFANYPIALIVNNIDVFQHIVLTAEESNIVYGRLGLDGAATLLLEVYPVAADDKTPVVMDNMPQYPMLSEIGYIGLINARAEQIWAWKSTKYTRGKNPAGTVTGADGKLIDLIPEEKK